MLNTLVYCSAKAIFKTHVLVINNTKEVNFSESWCLDSLERDFKFNKYVWYHQDEILKTWILEKEEMITSLCK